jgi:uncharacterized protein YdcH (DUF465 family)
MFEFDQDVVDALLLNSAQFRRLYDKYTTIKSRVRGANARSLTISQRDLNAMKREKLRLKDRMAEMIKNYRQVRA